MMARRTPPNAAAERTDHIAAIHTLKSKLQMGDDDTPASAVTTPQPRAADAASDTSG